MSGAILTGLWWVLLGGAGAAWASQPEGALGVGVGGSPGVSGLSAKLYLRRTAVQVMAGRWQLFGDEVEGGPGLGLSADYLLEMPKLGYTRSLEFSWSVGLGGTAASRTEADPYISATAVLGGELDFRSLPFDVVLEYRPRVAILPNLWADLFNYSAHIRYYF